MSEVDIQGLAPAHDRASLRCGVPALDRYLAGQASQDVRRRVGNCFVAVDKLGALAGYYTFAATSLPLTELAPAQAKRLPRHPLIPAALVGRLAVDERFKGRRLGDILVMDALWRCQRAELTIHALLVDAKDETAASFYLHLGFDRSASRPLSLFFPVAAAPLSAKI